MQRKKILKIFSLIFFVLFLSFSIPVNAEESEVSQTKLENIETNCHSIKTTLSRVKNTDKNSRLSLGRFYDLIENNFITPLNVRLVKNNSMDSKLMLSQNSFIEARSYFNHAYIAYSQELENLISTDCNSNPKSFYQKLEKTREKRKIVADSISEMKKLISEHIYLVENLKNSYKKAEK